MSVHKDELMSATTTDDEFAALMAASSLRSPRVTALDEVIPLEAQRQLDAAATTTSGTAPSHTAEEPDEEPAAPGDIDNSESPYRHVLMHLLTACNISHDLLAAAVAERARKAAADALLQSLRDWKLRELRTLTWYTDSDRTLQQCHTSRTLRSVLGRPSESNMPTRAEPVGLHTAAFMKAAQHSSYARTPGALALPLALRLISNCIWVTQECSRTQHDASPAPMRSDLLSQLWAGRWEAEAERGPAACPDLSWDVEDNRPAFGTLPSAWSPSSGRLIRTDARLTDLLRAAQPTLLSCPTERSQGLQGIRRDLSCQAMAHFIPVCAALQHQVRQPTCSPLTPGQACWPGTPSFTTSVRAHPLISQSSLLVAGQALHLSPAPSQTTLTEPSHLLDPQAYRLHSDGSLLLPRKEPDRADGPHRKLHRLIAESASKLTLERRRSGDGLEQHARLSMRLHCGEQDDEQLLPVHLIYRTADPYAVTAVFNYGSDEATEWVFARELLIDGLRTCAGIGDVVVWPTGDKPRQRIHIRLRSPEGTALLSAARADIEGFLRASQPLTLNPAAATAASCALDAWERELADTLFLGPRE